MFASKHIFDSRADDCVDHSGMAELVEDVYKLAAMMDCELIDDRGVNIWQRGSKRH